MSFFSGGKKSGIKPVKGVIRTIKVQNAAQPTALPSARRARQDSSQPQAASPRASYPSTTTSPVPSSDRQDSPHQRPLKRQASRQLSPAERCITTDSSSEGDEDGDAEANASDTNPYKRLKNDQPVDFRRKLRCDEAFVGTDGGAFEMIHAMDVKYPGHVPKSPSDIFKVRLKYPSVSRSERFDLISDKNTIDTDSLKEIVEVARIVRDVYLSPKQAKVFSDPDSGIIRNLERATNEITSCKRRPGKDLLKNFESAVRKYNNAIKVYLENGSLAKNLEHLHHLSPKLVQLILKQAYERSVSPRVDLLNKYQTGSDEVYGELCFPFVRRVLTQLELNSDQVFVDLGSGVGNVVLQAALQFGCESWGCEMMPNACELADRQVAEFAARCRLWGLHAGKVHLEKGDFLANDVIKAALRKADVVLVNNEVFSSETNEALRYLFLDLKDGCYIISLQSFAVGNGRNENDAANLIQNQIYGEFSDGDVSWTSGRGRYFVATKDQGHLTRISAANKSHS